MSTSILPFKAITKLFGTIMKGHASGLNELEDVGRLATASLVRLEQEAERRPQGAVGAGKDQRWYDVFEYRDGVSRPVRRNLLLSAKELSKGWPKLLAGINPAKGRLEFGSPDPTIYTCVMAVCCLYDLLSPRSRKTPGTFFEVIVAQLLAAVSGVRPRKQIAIPGRPYKLPTDLVLPGVHDRSLVVSIKITTRERAVHAWAHQRILDQVFGDRYRSILVCGSEMQRDKEKGVNEICLPHQIGMFQEYVARLSGMYYLDPPLGYLKADFTKLLPVRSVGVLLTEDLPRLLG
jgi:hypothetical protein